MKIHLIKRQTIENYVSKNAQSRRAFTNWLAVLKFAEWNTTNDINNTFNSADLIDNNRVVFNIGGNNYRLICKYSFGETRVHLFIKWIGTHAEYDAICARNEHYTINHF